MITVQLIGGLGNQMFQYAAARAVAHRAKMPLKLDITAFANYRLRPYKLGCFNIIENFATEAEIRRFRKPRRRQIFAYANYKIRRILLPWHRRRLIEERRFSFDPDILKIDRFSYLVGYWQSEQYFADISSIIRREFTYKREPEEINRKMMAVIDRTNSVSVHVRRDDYVSDLITNQVHGVMGLDYYARAVSSIASRTTQPRFFVFSDDIAWAKQNFKFQFPISFIEHNGADKDYEDLRLMCHCKHHIVANSSFSWWGAWLCENPEKIVIAPKLWYAAPEMMDYHPALENWIRL